MEPRIDGVVEWSHPAEGLLKLFDDKITFNKWEIPVEGISDAVLNTERLMFKKRQTLLIRGESGKYSFGFYDLIEDDFEFPFAVRRTERRSFVGKAILFGIALVVFRVIWEIFKYSVGR